MNEELGLMPDDTSAFSPETEDIPQEADKSPEDMPSDTAEDTPLTSQEDELVSLRFEIKALREQIEEERAILNRMSIECEEFSQLYPNVPLSSLPDSIWESVKKGTPIAAAYALIERRAAVAQMRADEVNKTNSLLSSGSVDSPPAEEFFSPAEVRAMSREQVKANYSKIINSMSKWH